LLLAILQVSPSPSTHPLWPLRADDEKKQTHKEFDLSARVFAQSLMLLAQLLIQNVTKEKITADSEPK